MTARKPHSIPEALRALKALLPPEQLDVIRRSTEIDLIRFHFNIGSYIRNLWVYRGGSPLTRKIRGAGGRIGEGDEISNLLLEALWHDLNQTRFDILSSTHLRRIAPNEDSAQKLAAVLLTDD